MPSVDLTRSGGWCYTELAISTASGTVVNEFSSDVSTTDQAGEDARFAREVPPEFRSEGVHEEWRPSNRHEDLLEILSARGDGGHVASEGRLHSHRCCVVRPSFRVLHCQC